MAAAAIEFMAKVGIFFRFSPFLFLSFLPLWGFGYGAGAGLGFFPCGGGGGGGGVWRRRVGWLCLGAGECVSGRGCCVWGLRLSGGESGALR